MTHIDPGAVCNDRSPGVYFWGESPNQSDKWLIYLMGGAWCLSYEECEQRKKDYEYYTTSKLLPDTS